MKKKSIVILASVVVICALGLLCSQLFDWPVDTSHSSGNIGKSSRFSRKTAVGGVSNMQELIQNDASYKKSVVATYYVMQTRAQQFDALVELSNQTAGGIKEFEGVLKDMNEAKPLIDNVCASMAVAGSNLNAALGGEPCDELAESITNSALAYTTLQKQNKLADKFIDVADKYLAKNAGNDELKFVRDQWLSYQQVSASLNKDEKAAAELAAKGYQLSTEQTLAMLNNDIKILPFQNDIAGGIVIANEFDIDSPVCDIPTDVLNEITLISLDVNDMVGSEQKIGNEAREMVGNEAREMVGNEVREMVGSEQRIGNEVREMVGSEQRIGNEVREMVGSEQRIGSEININEMISQFGNIGNEVREMVGSEQRIGSEVKVQ